MPFGLTFNSGPFIHTMAGRKVPRNLKKLLDGIGPERLGWAIDNNRPLTAFFTPDQANKMRTMYPLPKEMLAEFPDTEVYGWIPPEYRSFIEQRANGKKWAMEQIAFLRSLVITT